MQFNVMQLWIGIVIGAVGLIVLCVVIAALAVPIVTLATWAEWKRLQIRKRAEWTYENPYWKEAWNAGVKWADEGKPRMTPFLGELRMPKGD